MKASKFLIILSLFLFARPVQAQLFGKIKDKLENKAAEIVEEKLNGKNEDNKEGKTQSKSKITLEEVYDFKPGDSTIFASNFNSIPSGAMPLDWKTTSTGEVVSINEIGGKWLKMGERTTYKLNKNIYYPTNFTLEFDILVAADKVNDLSSLYFGFTKDNSIRGWISNENIWAGKLEYMNNNDINISSRANDLYQSSSFDLETYANQVMHVAIEVNQNRVKIYLDKTKIADTELFNNEKAKHFYISSPLRQNHGARVLFSNFIVKTYK